MTKENPSRQPPKLLRNTNRVLRSGSKQSDISISQDSKKRKFEDLNITNQNNSRNKKDKKEVIGKLKEEDINEETESLNENKLKSNMLDNIGSHKNFNKDISDILKEIGMIEKNRGEIFKYQQYLTACESLSSCPHRVTSGEEAQKNLNGVGRSISKKIQEILDTGKLEYLDKLRKDPEIISLNELCQVYGIGPKKAKELISNGITTVKQLKDNEKDIHLTHKQRLGIQLFNSKPISRKETEEHITLIKKIANKIEPKLIIDCVGGFRRNEKEIKVIEIMVSHPKYKTQDNSFANKIIQSMIQEMTNNNYLSELIESGCHQFEAVVNLKGKLCRMDIKMVPMESYYTALFALTGPQEYQRQLRKLAKLKGYQLSIYHLSPRSSLFSKVDSYSHYKVGQSLRINSEEDIYDTLKLKYKTPEERNFIVMT